MILRPRFFLLTGLIVAFSGAAALHAQTPGAGANFETRLDALEEETRNLEGRIEQTEFANQKLNQSFQRMQTDLDARLSRIESAMPAPGSAPATPPPVPSNVTATAAPRASSEEPPSGPINGTLGSLKTTPEGNVVGGSVNPKQPPLPETPPDYGLTPEEQYDRAFDLLRKTDYANAEIAFRNFIDKNPQDKLAGNAKYWYGETLYVQNKYDQAAVTFAEAYQANPRGEKAPDNLLDLAKSLAALGKTQDACATLDSLKAKYPNATLKTRENADQTRAKLKCGATGSTTP